jgi:hypothetical protein
MNLEFSGDIFQWRGPSPYFFVTIPQEESDAIKSVSREVTYGWGVIPVMVRIGKTEFKTSLFPREDRYLVPLKDAVRKAEKLDAGDTVTIRLYINM